MNTSLRFPGFDGLMTLSRREGVDIRPTLLRVLTDLYVQAGAHSSDEERQFVELASRLIDQVDDATRAAVRARLAIYPGAPVAILAQLGLKPSGTDEPASLVGDVPARLPASGPEQTETQGAMPSTLAMQPKDAAEIHDMFFRANGRERAAILHNLGETPLKPSPRIPESRAVRAIETLEMAAFASDVESFAIELGESLILPARMAAQVVDDPGGEPLACAARALGMPSAVFQRILLFLKPEMGSSVQTVYRLSRLYDTLSERSALIMLAAWRGSMMVTSRAKHRPVLHDDDRQRARGAGLPARSDVQPGSAGIARTGTDGARR
jgi:hypothetical protein